MMATIGMVATLFAGDLLRPSQAPDLRLHALHPAVRHRDGSQVFITSLCIDRGDLLVEDERGKSYWVDLATRGVRREETSRSRFNDLCRHERYADAARMVVDGEMPDLRVDSQLGLFYQARWAPQLSHLARLRRECGPPLAALGFLEMMENGSESWPPPPTDRLPELEGAARLKRILSQRPSTR